jgi:hypothetical protein
MYLCGFEPQTFVGISTAKVGSMLFENVAIK